MFRAVLGLYAGLGALVAIGGSPEPAQAQRAADQITVWRFATAAERSNYHDLGLALQERLGDRGFAIQVVPTEGSYENVERLRSSDSARSAQIALLQNDVAYLEHFQGRPYQALMSLNPEQIHVVVRRELGVEWASDLTRLDRPVLDVAIGEEGSGSAAHALALLDELGLRECSEGPGRTDGVTPCLRLHTLPLTDALRRLTDRRVPREILGRWDVAAEDAPSRPTIDMAFVTSTAPVEELTDLADGGLADAFSLLGIDWDVARSMRRHNPFFVVRDLPYDVYGVETMSRRTLGTPTLLVTVNDVPDELVVALLEEVKALAGSPRAEDLTLLTGLRVDEGPADVAIPVHPVADAYFRGLEPWWKRWLKRSRSYGLLVGVVLLPLVFFHFLSGTAYRLQRRRLGRILGLLVYVWMVGATALYVFEGGKQSTFTPWGQSAVATLHYLLSGLESKYPATMGGIMASIAILTVGVTVVALFTGEIARMLMERTLNVRRLRAKPFEFAARWRRSAGKALSSFTLKDHVVLVGWSQRTERVLRQLQSEDLGLNPQVVVITPSESEAETSDRSIARNAWVVAGHAHDRFTLERADLATARAALVTTETEKGSRLATVAVVREMDHLRTESGSGVRLAVEARCPEMVEYLRTFNAADDVIETQFLGERLLAQCVMTPGVVRVYDELLTFQKGGMEIYSAPMPAVLQGLPFSEVRLRLASTEVLPVGLQGAGGLLINPGPGVGGAQLDRLLFIADHEGTLDRASREVRATLRAARPGPREENPRPGASIGGEMVETVEQTTLRLAVCGWNRSARGLIEQLFGSELGRGRHIEVTVIDDLDPADLVAVQDDSGLRRFEPRDREHLPEEVAFVIGDPTRREVLQKAGVTEVDALVVASSRTNGEIDRYSDHRSLVVCLAAKALVPDLHVVVELASPESRDHFRGLTRVDLVCLEDLAEKLLAQAAISPGITRVYSELLHAADESNEIYIVPVSSRWRGETFQKLVTTLAEAAEPVIPLGYRIPGEAGGSLVLNPPRKCKQVGGVERWREHRLEEGDAVIVMADHEPRL